MADGEGWTWWVGHDDERYTTQCDSRDEAVQIAQEEFDGAHIVEAKKPANLKLSQQFDIELFLERAEEAAWEEHADEGSDDPVYDVSEDQKAALLERVRSAIDDWQMSHGLKFQGFKFSAQRNEEYIPPSDEDAA